jgi:hypothetical protein
MLEIHRVRMWAEFVWLRKRFGGGSREHGSEASGSIKGGEFNQPNDLKKDCDTRVI